MTACVIVSSRREDEGMPNMSPASVHEGAEISSSLPADVNQVSFPSPSTAWGSSSCQEQPVDRPATSSRSPPKASTDMRQLPSALTCALCLAHLLNTDSQSSVFNSRDGYVLNADDSVVVHIEGDHMLNSSTVCDPHEDESLFEQIFGTVSCFSVQTSQFAASTSSEFVAYEEFLTLDDFKILSSPDVNMLPVFNDLALPISTADDDSLTELIQVNFNAEFYDDMSDDNYQGLDTILQRSPAVSSQAWEVDQPTTSGKPDQVDGSRQSEIDVFESSFVLQFLNDSDSETPRSSPPHTAPIPPVSYHRPEQESGDVHLVNLVLTCADAVGSKNLARASLIFSRLSTMVTATGDPMQRVAFYFTYGMLSRMAGTPGSGRYKALGWEEPTLRALMRAHRYSREISPFAKFCGLVTNQAFLDALEGQTDVHLVDFSMVTALEWMSLLADLSARSGGPPAKIRFTTVILSQSCCMLSFPRQVAWLGKKLIKYARSLGLEFQFRTVMEHADRLQAWMLHSPEDAGTAVVVNCTGTLHKLLNDESGCAIANVLFVVRTLRPKVVSILEQDAHHNGREFIGKFLEALQFYSAIFDSLAAAATPDSQERTQIEQLWLGREIINIIGCDGVEFVERYETSQQWRSRLSRAGFQVKCVSERCVSEIQKLLQNYCGDGFNTTTDQGSLILRWKERTLFCASLWE